MARTSKAERLGVPAGIEIETGGECMRCGRYADPLLFHEEANEYFVISLWLCGECA